MKLTFALLLSSLLAVAPGILPAVASAQDSASFHYEEALKAFDADDLEGAVLALKESLQRDPGLLPSLVLVARIYLHIGEPAAAEESIKRARRLGADVDITWPLRTEALLNQRKYKELLALAPSEGLGAQAQSRVLVHRGHALMEVERFDDAAASFAAAGVLTPGEADPHVANAILALRQGQVYPAEALAIKSTRVAPQSATAWNTLGDVYLLQGRAEESLQAYERALQVDAGHREAGVARAGILIDLGRVDDAAEAISALRTRFPLDPRAAYLESVQLAKQKRWSEARDALERAAALLEELGAEALNESRQLVLMSGLAYYELGQLEQAQGQLERYVKRYPNEPGPRKLLGSILLRNDRAQEAVIVLEPALERAPRDFRLLGLLGSAYMRLGRHDLATSYLETAVRLSGGDPQLRTRLAMSRVGSGFDAQGLGELAALFDSDPVGQQAVGLRLATLYLQRGELQLASQICRSLLEHDPRNATVLNLLGAVQMQAGRFGDARTSFEQALALDGEHVPARVNLGKLSAVQGDLAEARNVFEEALRQRPSSVFAMVQLADVERRSGRIQDAERWLQKAIGADSRSLSATLALVDLYLESDRSADALRIAREAESREPDNLDVLEALARSHLADARQDLASGVYQRMAQSAGFDTQQLLRVARLQAQVGELGAAAYNLSKGLKQKPRHVDTRLLLIEIQTRLGQMELAIDGANALLADEPGLVIAHRVAGNVYLAAGQTDEAARHYRAALEREPHAVNVIGLYRSLARGGQAEPAMQVLTSWLERRPEDTEVGRALAQAHLAAGALDQARDHYRIVLEQAPLDRTALNNMAYILDLQGEPTALDFAERAYRLSPNDPAVLDTYGWLLVRSGRHADGLRYLREANSRASGNPEVLYHIASALAAMDRHDEARRELRKALAASGEFMGIADARALMQRLDGL